MVNTDVETGIGIASGVQGHTVMAMLRMGKSCERPTDDLSYVQRRRRATGRGNSHFLGNYSRDHTRVVMLE